MSINFEPFADCVVVEPMPVGMTAGGLALPENADTGPQKGTVIAVGPGQVSGEGVRMPMEAKPGDVVYLMFAYATPMELPIGGKKYLLTRSRDIVGRIPQP